MKIQLCIDNGAGMVIIKTITKRNNQVLKHVVDDIVFQSKRDIEFLDSYIILISVMKADIVTVEDKTSLQGWIQYYHEKCFLNKKCKGIVFEFEPNDELRKGNITSSMGK